MAVSDDFLNTLFTLNMSSLTFLGGDSFPLRYTSLLSPAKAFYKMCWAAHK